MHIRTLISALVMWGVSSATCAGLLGFGGTSWKEEVLLHDGTKIIVSRSTERGGRHEIGQEPPFKNQSVEFTIPETGYSLVWEDRYSKDVGGANFNVMLLDIVNGVPYVLATPAGCLSYNKWGRPNPPYVVFKFIGKEWLRIPLEELPSVVKTPNLILSSPDHEAQKANGAVVSAETIRRHYNDYNQPQYKTVLREALPNGGSGCIKTDYYRNAGWLSPDWFSDQPSLEACTRFCDHKKIIIEDCPCKTFFKEK